MAAVPATETPKPVVRSTDDEYAGVAVIELFNCPVIVVTPFDATEPVRAVAMSEKSLLTAADEITEPGVKGA